MEPLPTEPRQYDWIDALRGLAILSVIACHCGKWIGGVNDSVKRVTEYGQMGVELFFVISAITLCFSYTCRLEDRNKIRSFFIRRIFRIAPLYYLGIAFYFCWAAYQRYPGTLTFSWPPEYTPASVVLNLFFLHGFSPSAINTIVKGGWSIGVEMGFYVLFPWLVANLLRKNGTSLCFAAGLIAGSLGAELAIGKCSRDEWLGNNHYLYYTLLNQLPVFIVGILGFRYLALLQRIPTLICIAVFILFSSPGIVYFESPHRLIFFVVPLSSAISFLMLVALGSRQQNFYSSNLLCKLGKVSYSMYLWHFVILEASMRLGVDSPSVLPNHPHVKLFLLFYCVVCLTYTTAKFSYALVERPFIRLGSRIIKVLNKRTQVESLCPKQGASLAVTLKSAN